MRLRRPKTTRGARLSILRIALAMLAVGGVAMVAAHVTSTTLANRGRLRSQWFAPYVDVTLPPYLDFQDPAVNPNGDVVLSFVVADPEQACVPSWGAAYTMREASTSLDLDRRLVKLRARGGDAIVSFGGVANDELATTCTSELGLYNAYRSVVDRYDLQTIDLDLEGDALTDRAARTRRAQALADLQAERRGDGGRLAVWITLPMGLDGLTLDGVETVRSMLEAGVDLAGINVMAMDYGAGRPASTTFVDASIEGLGAASRQVRAAYRADGVVLTPAEAYGHLGVTPMIGQNDELDDRLTTDGARQLFDAAVDRGVARFSMWSLNRDVACGGNVDPTIADNACSGVEQDRLEFSSIFGAVGGRATAGAVVPVVAARPTGRTDQRTDDSLGPYDSWRLRREYEATAKVVWRGQVYVAKWWNVGTQPDARVAHEWDSPWRGLGPVLPGERKAVEPPALPKGTYHEWSRKTGYNTGDVVQHLGKGYRAKWATQGADPAADVDNDWESPWEPVARAGAGTDHGATAPAP